MCDQIFVWGSNEHNQCFVKDLKTISHFDGFNRRLHFNEKIVSVACGASHCLILTEDGEVYSWGNNNVGQVGGTKYTVKYPRKICIDHNCSKSMPEKGTKLRISKISAGGMFSIFVTNCGCIIKRGSIFGDVNQPVDVPLRYPSEKVDQVSCGVCHVVLLLSTGHVACFGRNMYGQIGVHRTDLERNVDTVSTPRVISQQFSHRITMVCAGSYHSLCCNEINQILCWGYGVPCGIRNSHVMQPSLLPGLCQPLRKIAAGSSHSLFLTESRSIYGIGGNEFSQAAINCDLTFIDTLTEINYFTEVVDDIFCGENYSIVKMEDGTISMWGKNSLVISANNPISSNFKIPQTIPLKSTIGDSDIVSISCGSWHVLCHVSSRNNGTIPERACQQTYSSNHSISSTESNVNHHTRSPLVNLSRNTHDNIVGAMPDKDLTKNKHHLTSIHTDINANALKRERTFTTLRELYSKTPNPVIRVVSNETGCKLSKYDTRRNIKNAPKETCQNFEVECSTEDGLVNQNVEKYDPGGLAHSEKVQDKNIVDITRDGGLEHSEDTMNRDPGRFTPRLNISMKKSDRNTDHQVRRKSEDETEQTSSSATVTSRDVRGCQESLRCDEIIVKTRAQRILPKLFERHFSRHKTEDISFQKSKTEFLSTAKHFFISKNAVEGLQRTFTCPHMVNMQLDKRCSLHNDGTFLFRGKMKTSFFGR